MKKSKIFSTSKFGNDFEHCRRGLVWRNMGSALHLGKIIFKLKIWQLAIITVIMVIQMLFAANCYAIDFNMDEILSSVVTVRTGLSVGTGFAVSNDKIITNQHVTNGFSEFIVESKSGGMYTAKLIATDAEKDLSLALVAGADFKTIPMTTDMPPLGTDLYAVGSPQGMNFSVSRGVLSTADREVGGVHYIQTDAAINPGNSGGPLINQKGQVIGVNNMRIQDADRISLAVPMSSVIEFLSGSGAEVIISDPNSLVLESPGSIVVQSGENTDYTVQSEEQYANDLRNQYNAVLSAAKRQNKILLIALIALAILCFIFMLAMLSQKDRLRRSAENFDKAVVVLKRQNAQIRQLKAEADADRARRRIPPHVYRPAHNRGRRRSGR